jgi:hypothetical protein
MIEKIIHVPHAPDCQLMTSPWLFAACTCGSAARFAQYLAEQESVCKCELIDVSTAGGKPEFMRGKPTGCPVHGREYDAEVAAAKQRARDA